ncbi:MAG: phosphatidate cytidylyltransferase [Magnetococcales bacterium]|nr:phosphatidate cytidylyltransferase [Magnetococcales bacterium]MBF0116331.1 phosphatidate cytidylyltransferase [Magnetococcales bacterium]
MSTLVLSPLLKRILSALVLAPPLLYVLLLGSPHLLFFVVVPVAGLMVHEWHRLREPLTVQGVLPLLLAVVWIMAGSYPGWGEATPEGGVRLLRLPFPLLATMLLLLFFIEGMVRYRSEAPVLAEVGRRFFGVIYCSLPMVMLLEIRQAASGGWLLCYLLFTIWATDIGAFFAGRRWGRRKLALSISPGKTWAGFWGGLLLAALTGMVLTTLVALPFAPWQGMAMAALLSLVGQLGDLAESLAKREAGVKDSGNLIPGHGGLLDRLDSLLFATPVFYLLLWLMALLPVKGVLALGG